MANKGEDFMVSEMARRIEKITKNEDFRNFTEEQIGLVKKVEINENTKTVTISSVSAGDRIWSWSDFLEFEPMFIK